MLISFYLAKFMHSPRKSQGEEYVVESPGIVMPQLGGPRAVSNQRVGEQVTGVGGSGSLWEKDAMNSRGRNLKDWRGSGGGCAHRKQTYEQWRTEPLGCLEEEDEGAGDG